MPTSNKTGKLPKSGRIRVLESFGPPHSQTNPYIIQLYASLPSRIDAQYFSWRRALTGSFDVFHLHWPEIFVRGVSRPKALIRGTLFLLILLRIRLGKKALVRTLHDRTPHEPPNFLQAWVIGLSERWTTLWITLSSDSTAPSGAPTRRSVIGHFVDWFEPAGVDETPVESVPGRLLHFGLVRRYKGVTTLLREFHELNDPALSLRIVGVIHDDALRAELKEFCRIDSRISANDSYVSDDVLRAEVLASSLVVLPFTRITNSSSVILALSLNRPVLAPCVPSIKEVADEVGHNWVHLYEGQLEAVDIQTTLAELSRSVPEGAPDLSLRAWSRIGEEHADAFEAAWNLVI